MGCGRHWRWQSHNGCLCCSSGHTVNRRKRRGNNWPPTHCLDKTPYSRLQDARLEVLSCGSSTEYTSKTQACSVVFIVILQDLVNCEIELWILKLFTLNLSQSSMAKIGQSLGWIGNICSRYQSNSHHKVVLIWPPVHLICLEFCILTVILLYKGLFQLYGQLSSSFDMIINALHTNLNDNTLCCITIVLV